MTAIIEWRRMSDYHLRSDCRRYTIAKVIVLGEFFYEAWRAGELLQTRLLSADAAKAVCHADVLQELASEEPA